MPPNEATIEHKAVREKKRAVKPAARGLAGSLRGGAPQSPKRKAKMQIKQ